MLQGLQGTKKKAEAGLGVRKPSQSMAAQGFTISSNNRSSSLHSSKHLSQASKASSKTKGTAHRRPCQRLSHPQSQLSTHTHLGQAVEGSHCVDEVEA
jgi:hypothetical protein